MTEKPRSGVKPLRGVVFSGASAGSRTPYLLITNQLLCRVSYAGKYLERYVFHRLGWNLSRLAIRLAKGLRFRCPARRIALAGSCGPLIHKAGWAVKAKMAGPGHSG